MERVTAVPRRALAQAALGIALIFGGIFALGWYLREPITAWSTQVVERWGALGIFVMVAVMDPVPGPGHDLGLVVGHAGGLGFWSIWIAASMGSLMGSLGCWAAGLRLGRWRPLRLMLERYRLDHLFDRYGAAAVAIGAVGPFPWLLVTMGAGACNMRFQAFFLGAAARSLKIGVALLLIMAGWEASG